MKTSRKLLIFATMVLFPVALWAAPGDPGTGLASSAHDFSGITSNGEETGTCTFCHTPHRASAQSLIWNHDLSTDTFAWTDPTTTGGTDYVDVDPSYKGSTAKCLSCHDGSVAVGDIGWWAGSDPGTVAYTSVAVPTGTISGAPLEVTGAGNNHPVAMPYPLGNAASTYNTATTGSGVVLTKFVADPTVAATFPIRLYQDDGSGNISVGPIAGATGMECGSCHDPHNGLLTTQDSFFLRGLVGGNTADYLCVKCHSK